MQVEPGQSYQHWEAGADPPNTTSNQNLICRRHYLPEHEMGKWVRLRQLAGRREETRPPNYIIFGPIRHGLHGLAKAV
jgi:hypothetical protein